MKTKIYLLVATLACLCLVGWVGQAQRQNESRRRWDYIIVPTNDAFDGQRQLNDLGTQGWELVAVSPYNNSSSGSYYHLKRARD